MAIKGGMLQCQHGTSALPGLMRTWTSHGMSPCPCTIQRNKMSAQEAELHAYERHTSMGDMHAIVGQVYIEQLQSTRKHQTSAAALRQELMVGLQPLGGGNIQPSQRTTGMSMPMTSSNSLMSQICKA